MMCDNVNIAYEELLNRVSSCMLTMKNNGIEERFPVLSELWVLCLKQVLKNTCFFFMQ